MTSPIDTAYVDIKPRTTGFGAEAEAGITSGLAGAEASVAAIIASMEAEFATLADSIIMEFRGVGVGIESALGGVESATAGVANSIDAQFNETQASVNSSFDSIRNNAVRDLDEVEAKSVSSGGIVAGAFGKIASGAKLAFLGVATGAGLLTTLGLKSAASLEQVNIAFDSLTGSVQRGNAQFAALQKFAAATPFRFQDLTTAAQRFDAFSASIGQSQDQLIPFLNTIGNLVSETGGGAQALDSISLALGQTASQGKLTLGNLNQINNAIPGFSSVAALAAVRGESTAQVMQEISAGSINAKDGINQLLVGMQQFPGAAGAMDKQAQTLLGVFSTFQDTVSQALSNAFKPVIPAIKTTLTQITPIIGDALTTLAPALGGILNGLLTLAGPLVKALSALLTPLLSALGPAIAQLGPVITALAGPLAAILSSVTPLLPVIVSLANQFAGLLGPAIMQLVPFIQQLVSSFVSLLPQLQPVIAALGAALQEGLGVALVMLTPLLSIAVDVLSTLLTVITPLLPILPQIVDAYIAWNVALAVQNVLMDANPIGLVIIAVAALTVGIIEIVKHWDTVVGVLKTVWGWFLKFGAPILAVVAPFIGIPLLIIGHWKQVSSFFVRLWNDITGALSTAYHAVVGFFEALPGNILSVLTALPGQLLALIEGAMKGILFAIGFSLGLIVREFMAFPGQVLAVIRFLFVTLPIEVAKGIASLAVSFWHGLQNIIADFSQFNTWLINLFLSLGGKIVDALVSFVKSVPHAFETAGKAIKNAVTAFLRDVVQYFKDLPGNIVQGMKNLGTTIKNFFIQSVPDAAKWLYNAGKNVIKGLVNGIKDSFGDIWNIVSDAASHVISGFKSAMGIGSPSKVFAELGKFTMQGYQIGVKDNTPETTSLVSNVLNAPIRQAGATPHAQGAAAGGGIVFQSGSIMIAFNGVVPTQQEALATGQAVGNGIAQRLAVRNINSTVRAL